MQACIERLTFNINKSFFENSQAKKSRRVRHGQHDITGPIFTCVESALGGKHICRSVGWMVVQEPSRAPLFCGLVHSLKISPLYLQDQGTSLGQEQAQRPNLHIHLINLSWLQELRFVVRMKGPVRQGFGRINFPL